jgi:coenzyme F420-0:L-glutamate ligase/coenzyme F420-1:gamma-L-glutamate ligase
VTPAKEIRAIPVVGLGEIRPGASIVAALLSALRRSKQRFRRGDILVIKHKIVSKAEGRLVPLDSIHPRRSAVRWARRYGLDPRLVELALQQARRVVRKGHRVMITETAHGLVCANSGVDLSNVDGGASALLLPDDPDRSAARIYRELRARLKFSVPVIISDSFGRPWREGLTEVAIGVAGMNVFRDFRGSCDRYGYRLHSTLEAVADELACAAGLACGKLSEIPACIIRGYQYEAGKQRGRDILRAPERDLFR